MANYRRNDDFSTELNSSSEYENNGTTGNGYGRGSSYLSNARSMLSIGRQKIISAVESSKEQGFLASIPKSITQSFSYDESVTSTQGVVIVPDDAKIQLFKSYSRVSRHGYITNVKGLLYCDGVMNRRNRLLFSLIQKLAKPSTPNDVGNVLSSELEDALVNPDSLDSSSAYDSSSMTTHSSSSSSTPTSGSISGDIIKERMKGVMARTISKAPIRLSIGSEEKVDSLLGANFTTDNSGYFEFSIATPYRPSFAMVSSLDNSRIMVTVDLEIIEETGVSVITDIDDTIRVTGVLKDKREMISNVFSKDFIDCEIPGLSEWFNMLYNEKKCAIHYVSNSPWQVYNVVTDFMDFVSLPSNSIHLRQYSGNLIASFTQPSGERKRGSLINILKDFPSRKFILVGDSGEQDLEAYLSLAKEFPDNVVAIYIRAMDDAFSLIDNMRVFQELEAKLLTRNAVYTSVHALGKSDIDISDMGLTFEPHIEDEEVPGTFPEEEGERQDQSRKEGSLNLANATNTNTDAKLKPIVPLKPKSLRGEALQVQQTPASPSSCSSSSSPPLNPNVLSRRAPPPPAPPSRRSRQPDEVPNPEFKPQRQQIPPPLPSRARSAKSTSPPMRSATYPIMNTGYGDHSHTGWDLNHDNLDFSEEEDYTYGTDKRRELWRDRINRVLMELPPNIAFKFWWTVDDIIIDSLEICDKAAGTKPNQHDTAKGKDDVKPKGKTKEEPENLIDL